MAAILMLHGPNLNLLGTREPEVYGTTTLQQIDQRLCTAAAKLGHQLSSFQSNAEHTLIERVHQARDDDTAFIIINPGALTHTSISLRDALLAVGIPFIEVHISNVYAREDFRQYSYLSGIAVGVVSGLGVFGYELALLAADRQLRQQDDGH